MVKVTDTALAAIGQARSVLELQGKLTGEMDKSEEQAPALSVQVLLQNMIAMPKVGAGVPKLLPPSLDVRRMLTVTPAKSSAGTEE